MFEEIQIPCFLQNIFRISGIRCASLVKKKKRKERKNQECEGNVEGCEMCQMEDGENKQQSTKCIVM